MKLVLNGWQRLWVLVSIILLIPVVVVAVITFPNPDHVSHQSSFEENLSAESRTKLATPDEKGIVWDDKVGLKVEMPNGHILRFEKSVKNEEAETVANEYYGLLKHQANKERVLHVLLAIAWWLGPAIFLYAFGRAVAWVYKGFKKSP